MLQSASVVFVGHPSLQIGLAPELIRMVGADSRNAVLLMGAFDHIALSRTTSSD